MSENECDAVVRFHFTGGVFDDAHGQAAGVPAKLSALTARAQSRTIALAQ